MPCNTADSHPVDVEYLDAFARTQWEGILHYMVGSTGVGVQGAGDLPSPAVRELLRLGGLVEVKGKRPEITQAGFSFLLQEVNAQVWTMLIFYLENAESVSTCYTLHTELH